MDRRVDGSIDGVAKAARSVKVKEAGRPFQLSVETIVPRLFYGRTVHSIWCALWVGAFDIRIVSNRFEPTLRLNRD